MDEADLGVNFFLDQSCLGKSRAQCVTSLLCELNPEVEGAWYPNAEVRCRRHDSLIVSAS